MTIQEIESALGPRGRCFVKSGNNRDLVKRWLRMRGIPSATAERATLRELADAYNDSTDAKLASIEKTVADRLALKAEMEKRKAEGAYIPADDPDEAQRDADESDEIATAASPPTPASGLGSAIEQLIAGTLAGIKPGLDESSVKTLIDERIAEVGVLRHDVTVRTESGEIAAEIKGAHYRLPVLLKAMQARQANGRVPNIMLSGPTGSGKTHAVEQCAKALGLEFWSNGAISQDYQLVGFRDASGTYRTTPLREAFGRPAVYLFDEFDSSDNSPMLCIAAVLANSGFHFPDEFVSRHVESRIICAGNTWGSGATADFCGRNKIDAAIRSRFPVRIAWPYDEKLEIAMSGNPAWAARVQKARALAVSHGLKVIIDPRMTQAGAGLIAQGFTDDEAAEMTYLADLNPDQRKMLVA